MLNTAVTNDGCKVQFVLFGAFVSYVITTLDNENKQFLSHFLTSTASMVLTQF